MNRQCFLFLESQPRLGANFFTPSANAIKSLFHLHLQQFRCLSKEPGLLLLPHSSRARCAPISRLSPDLRPWPRLRTSPAYPIDRACPCRGRSSRHHLQSRFPSSNPTNFAEAWTRILPPLCAPWRLAGYPLGLRPWRMRRRLAPDGSADFEKNSIRQKKFRRGHRACRELQTGRGLKKQRRAPAKMRR